jgi:hypothetical protein
MGTSHKSWWTGRVRHGRGQHYLGTTPVYMLASAVFRMSRPPLVVGGLGMLRGYLGALWRGDQRYGDDAFRSFLRRYQWACLLQGKHRATATLNARQAPRWNPVGPPLGEPYGLPPATPRPATAHGMNVSQAV